MWSNKKKNNLFYIQYARSIKNNMYWVKTIRTSYTIKKTIFLITLIYIYIYKSAYYYLLIEAQNYNNIHIK